MSVPIAITLHADREKELALDTSRLPRSITPRR